MTIALRWIVMGSVFSLEDNEVCELLLFIWLGLQVVPNSKKRGNVSAKYVRANRPFRGNLVRLNMFVITKSIPMVRSRFYGIKGTLPTVANLLYCAVSNNPRITPWLDGSKLFAFDAVDFVWLR